MEIKITMHEGGRISVDVSEGFSVLSAVGFLEVAKNMILNGENKPTTEPESEIIPDEV